MLAPTAHRLQARTSLCDSFICPPCDLAGHTLPVQRKQAAHALRVGGHLGLRLRWLWPKLGFGGLPLATVAAVATGPAVAAATSTVAQPAATVAKPAAAVAKPVISVA